MVGCVEYVQFKLAGFLDTESWFQKDGIICEKTSWFILDMLDNKEACLHTAVHVYTDYERVWQKEIFFFFLFFLLFAWVFWLHTEVNVFKCQTWDRVDVMSNLQTTQKHEDLICFPRSSGLTCSDLQPKIQMIMAAVNVIQTDLDVCFPQIHCTKTFTTLFLLKEVWTKLKAVS